MKVGNPPSFANRSSLQLDRLRTEPVPQVGELPISAIKKTACLAVGAIVVINECSKLRARSLRRALLGNWSE